MVGWKVHWKAFRKPQKQFLMKIASVRRWVISIWASHKQSEVCSRFTDCSLRTQRLLAFQSEVMNPCLISWTYQHIKLQSFAKRPRNYNFLYFSSSYKNAQYLYMPIWYLPHNWIDGVCMNLSKIGTKSSLLHYQNTNMLVSLEEGMLLRKTVYPTKIFPRVFN